VRRYIERGLEPPAYGSRQVGRPSKLAPFLDYLRERIAAFPDLTAVRLTREIQERGYNGAYTAVKLFVSAIRRRTSRRRLRFASRHRPATKAKSTSRAL
jgi:transposase